MTYTTAGTYDLQLVNSVPFQILHVCYPSSLIILISHTKVQNIQCCLKRQFSLQELWRGHNKQNNCLHPHAVVLTTKHTILGWKSAQPSINPYSGVKEEHTALCTWLQITVLLSSTQWRFHLERRWKRTWQICLQVVRALMCVM